MNFVKTTLYISICIQLIGLIMGTIAQFKPLPDDKRLLKDVMTMENIVQLIEFTFYISISIFVSNLIDTDIAKFRYYDWVLTTPIMLLTTLIFFVYNNKSENKYGEKKEKKLFDIIKHEKESIIKIFLSNLGMLFVGYLQEIGKLDIYYSTLFGFGFLFYSFYKLYQYVGDFESKILFWIMFVLWSKYGFAAMMKNEYKNTMYNILDIFSKNFYGIFLAYKILF